MGGVFVVETLSVMIQVLSFKCTGGKRIFRMAPLHHHFELEGLEGEPGRRALLDHHDDAGAVRPVDAEAAMMREPAFRCCSADAMHSPASGAGARPGRHRPVARALARARRARDVRVADTRAAPPRARRSFAGRAARRPVRPSHCSTASTWSAISPGLSLDQPAIARSGRARHPGASATSSSSRGAHTAGAEGARDHRHQRQDHGRPR